MISKRCGIGILSLLLVLYIYGLKKLLICCLALVIGNVAAKYTMKCEFSMPFSIPIIKNNQFQKKKSAETTIKNHKRSISSSSIQSNASLDNSYPFRKSKKPLLTTMTAKETNFEAYFQLNHPWQSVYIPANIEKAIEEFLSLILQNFILTWYSKLSADDGLINELKNLFRHILANAIIRLKQIDVNYFTTFKLNTVLFNHISDFYFCYENHTLLRKRDLKKLTPEKRIELQYEMLKTIVAHNELNSHGDCHFALASRKHELLYLRQITKKVLNLLLPPQILKCRLTIELIEEIVVNKLLLKGLDILAEPDSINKILIKIFEKSEDSNSDLSAKPQLKVQLLKHWCLMNGCIYKSAKAPTFKEIIDNNELLHHFISYMNSLNSITILQLYLNLKEIFRSQHDEMSSSYHSNISSLSSTTNQVEELKIWCKNPINKRVLEVISFNEDLNFYEAISSILFNESNEYLQKEIHQGLANIHNEIFNLIKDVYYASFIKSDFMYKHLIGLQKINPRQKRSMKTSESTSLNSVNIAESRSENNLDLESDLEHEFEMVYYPTNYASRNADEMTDSLYEENEEFSEEFIEETHYENFENKTKDNIRLDLINEIKDEILDEPIADINQAEEDEDEDDEEENLTNIEPIIKNLNNLRICIDEIEEVTDKLNKTCFVFVIQVWNLQPTFDKLQQESEGIKSDELDEVPTWYVRRKYDEFYVLDNRLKEFHGGTIGNEADTPHKHQLSINIPNKQRTMFLNSNAKTLDYLNSVKNDFTKYLQSLITNPILSMSQLIQSFLDPNSIEFGSSIFNDITNLGKIVKGVPNKLRIERGQSLDSFLMALLHSVKDQKPKVTKPEPITEDIVADSLNNKLFSDPKLQTSSIKFSKNFGSMDEVFTTPFESFMLLTNFIYKFPGTISLLIFSIRKFIENSFDYLVYWIISRKVVELTADESIEKYIRLFKELIFDDDDEENLTSDMLYKNAFDTINQFIYEEIKLDKLKKMPFVPSEKIISTVEKGTELCLESFQYPILNKQLSYYLLDAIIQELFPELSLNVTQKKQ